MKKQTFITVLLAFIVWSSGYAQEAWQTHTRGLLHQSVFNTGALGVRYNAFRTINSGNALFTPFEWPGNSHFTYLNVDYWYYNQNGGGLMMLADTGRTGHRATRYIVDANSGTTVGADMIGCLGQGSAGTYMDGTGIHYWPGTVTKTTNYPLNTDGSWNASYNPNEAEEIITSSVYTPYGIKITRTSREWSYPGYDSFIIYDYEFKDAGEYFKNTTGAVSPTHAADTISNIAVDWVESFFPSYVYANQDVGDFTSGGPVELGRVDLRRYMTYVASPDGRPSKTSYADWSSKGTYGGGLRAPAAAGYMFLYYDYDHLMTRSTSRFFYRGTGATPNDSIYIFDANMKFKQPWVLSRTQANLTPTKAPSHVNGPSSRYAPWNPRNTTTFDSISLNTHNFGPAFANYWYGRARENLSNNTSNMVHSMVLGPYILPPDESFHVVVAEVAGFGPGRKWDAKYYDFGGGSESATTNDDFMHPVASWDSVITYPVNPPATQNYTPALNTLNKNASVGIAYTSTYGLPAYIRDTNVVSIRDVADRCIQLYTGNPNVIKFDTTQYEPWGNTFAASNGVTANLYAPSPTTVATRAKGWSAAIKIPLPAPVVTGYREASATKVVLSGLRWNNTVENLSSTISPYVDKGLKFYEVWRSTAALGPWTIIDTVEKQDARFWDGTEYSYSDETNHGVNNNGQTIGPAKPGSTYFYAVVSVDSAGKRSGLTNMLTQMAGALPRPQLTKVYAVPNPYGTVSGFSGETASNTGIQFYGLTKNCTIRVFSFSGQLLKTLHSDGNYMNVRWDLRTESLKKIASGVYYFTVEDNDTGSKAWNKFVVIH